jgi:hypothetical protein
MGIMNKDPHVPPDFELAGFRMWILGWEFPEPRIVWDSDWLLVRATCIAKGAEVWAEGPSLRSDDIVQLGAAMESLHALRTTSARIDPIEPNLAFRFDAGARGNLTFTVAITPDTVGQQHQFSFDIDLSYLPAAIAQCRAILARYSARDGR